MHTNTNIHVGFGDVEEVTHFEYSGTDSDEPLLGITVRVEGHELTFMTRQYAQGSNFFAAIARAATAVSERAGELRKRSDVFEAYDALNEVTA